MVAGQASFSRAGGLTEITAADNTIINYQSFSIGAGETVRFGKQELEVRLAPGHSPGSVVFIHHASQQVFAGDVLFAGSVGRFDLPGADGPTLLRSIREQLLTLPDDYTVHPGHGLATTIGRERRSNPFLQPGAEYLFEE